MQPSIFLPVFLATPLSCGVNFYLDFFVQEYNGLAFEHELNKSTGPLLILKHDIQGLKPPHRQT